jgi:RHS repeat-associated protein
MGRQSGLRGSRGTRNSGLDYFGARYYGSALGRFTSADPKLIPDEFDNPQSWNKYAYTGNNPLRYTDPDGKDWKDIVSGALNAVWSDNTLGVGRQSGNSDFKTGQAIGDGIAFVQGGVQIIAGAAGDAGGGSQTATGIGAALGVPAIAVSTAVGVDGVGVAGTAAGNLITAASATGPDKVHGNTAGNQPAELYEKTYKDGNLEKHGVSQDASKRYSKAEVGEGNVTVTDRGPRKEMLAKEREKVETNPGPKTASLGRERRRISS